MNAYTPDDFSGLNHGGLMMELQFFTASVTYHETELTSCRLGLALVEAEIAKREAVKVAA